MSDKTGQNRTLLEMSSCERLLRRDQNKSAINAGRKERLQVSLRHVIAPGEHPEQRHRRTGDRGAILHALGSARGAPDVLEQHFGAGIGLGRRYGRQTAHERRARLQDDVSEQRKALLDEEVKAGESGAAAVS